MCAWMCAFIGMQVFHCVCVHVQWCTWACTHCVLVVYRFLQWQALQQLRHTLRQQRFNLQEAQLCTKPPTAAQDSKHSSVTNGTELLAATTPLNYCELWAQTQLVSCVLDRTVFSKRKIKRKKQRGHLQHVSKLILTHSAVRRHSMV